MSVRQGDEDGAAVARRRSGVWQLPSFYYCYFFVIPALLSTPRFESAIDALVSPSASPLLIHPTQRAENGCKCIFLKGQSHSGDGQMMVMMKVIKGPRQECQLCTLEHLREIYRGRITHSLLFFILKYLNFAYSTWNFSSTF